MANNLPPLLTPARDQMRQQMHSTVERFHQQNDASEKLIDQQTQGLVKRPSGERKALGLPKPSGIRKAVDQQNKVAEEGLKRGYDALLKQTEREGRLPTPEELAQIGAGTGAAPYINQLNPVGRPPQYQGEMYCGPTAMAMIARARGLGVGETDGQLIERFARIGGTTDQGTSGNGMIAIGQELGLNTRAAPGADLRFINAELAQGRTVVAQGDFWALPEHADPDKTSGHYLLVQGQDAAGNYRVSDPQTSKVMAITADTLSNYMQALPAGGFSISFW
jgi:peptidase C39-like protein